MTSDLKTVDDYIAALPEDRREAIATLRSVILKNLPEGYQERMTWGMPTYEVPLDKFSDTYNGKPLMYAALASQKNHMAVYLTAPYMSDEALEIFEQKYKATGKKLDMGKSCVRFKTLEDLPIDVIGEYIALYPVDDFIQNYKDSRK